MTASWFYSFQAYAPPSERVIDSWLYHLGSANSTRIAEIGAHDTDLVVIDAYTYVSTPRLYTTQEVSDMRGANNKLVVSYISIGEAEDYRPYWDPAWETDPPAWMAAANPLWPDNYKVKYWDQDWKDIIFAYIDDIVDQGFNGLYLDIIDGFQFWEEEDPSSGINYRAEMATFVNQIRSRFTSRLTAIDDQDREFVIIGQNGEEMVNTSGYLNAIDGIGKEDLRFYDWDGGFKLVPEDWFTWSKVYLETAKAAGKHIMVVEYMTLEQQSTWASTLNDLQAYLDSQGFALYVAQERDLLNIYEQP